MKQIYFARHAKSDKKSHPDFATTWHLAAPTTAKGYAKLRELGESLRAVPFRFFFAAPNPRALMAVLGIRETPVIETFSGLGPGSDEGLRRMEEVDRHCAAVYGPDFSNEQYYADPVAAAFLQEEGRRVVKILRTQVLPKLGPGENALGGGHYPLIESAIGIFEGVWPPPVLELGKPQIAVLRFSDAGAYQGYGLLPA